ncbi:uncharacterized protein LOC114333322 isoform X2 [Diabrotica virgifera virgifera]|uniref:Uncharacterized protein LOC114333322 n=1 Tax=Diabrotica virgifera virgifera TaxID=50390 RepID=A0A6P7FSP5_DIAVI|nr:uncharacterized protein LOC114333322 isoform X2 [Diabrotica virgifera virgifera]
MKIVLLVLFAACLSQAKINQDIHFDWVQYTGEIPENAIIGGSTADGDPTYVARSFLSADEDDENYSGSDYNGYVAGGVLPGKLSIDLCTPQSIYTLTKNIEILTVVNGTKIEWIKSYQHTFMDLFNSDDYRPVRIGWLANGEKWNSTLYLGSSLGAGVETIGHIMTSAIPTYNNQQNWYPFYGSQFGDLMYKVLVYYI